MSEDEIIDQALTILERRLHKPDYVMSNPEAVADYLKLHYGGLEYESFRVMFLNNQNGLISLKEMFRGTVNAATIYPREVVKASLAFNAAAVILSHNHPSGDPTPSQADKQITHHLVDALKLVDVRVLDHIVVGGNESYSFADHGLM